MPRLSGAAIGLSTGRPSVPVWLWFWVRAPTVAVTWVSVGRLVGEAGLLGEGWRGLVGPGGGCPYVPLVPR